MVDHMVGLLVQLNLVEVLTVTPNTNLILDIVKLSAQQSNITNVPIFVDSQLGLNSIDELSAELSKDLTLVQYIITEKLKHTDDDILRNHINDETLSLLFCSNVQSRIWHTMDYLLRKLRRCKLLVVVTGKADGTYVDVEGIFAKVWQLQFLQVVVLVKDTVYSYEPFPKIRIYQIPELNADPFPPISTNMQGYVISTPVENDIPRIFCIPDGAGSYHVRGFGYQIFRHFLERLNATLHITNLNIARSITSSVNMTNILNMIGTGRLEISMHPYVSIDKKDGIMGYPIFKVENCLIVPVFHEIPRFMYIVRPFKWPSWLLIFLSPIYVSWVLVWISPLKSKSHIPFSSKWTRCFLDSISYILFRPATFVVYAPRPHYLFVYTLLAVLGFFVTNWYCNLLSSFMTTFIMGNQIDTVEDLIQAKFPILVKSHEIPWLLEQVQPNFVKLVNALIIPANASVQMSHLLDFNTSFSYPVTKERWTFFKLQQQYATRPIYRWSRICFGMPDVGYPMRLDSHLEHPMTQFIMDVQSAGLDFYWLMAEFKDALRAHYVRLVDNSFTLKPLDLDSLRVAWILILAMWLVSLLAFFGEYLWNANKRKRSIPWLNVEL